MDEPPQATGPPRDYLEEAMSNLNFEPGSESTSSRTRRRERSRHRPSTHDPFRGQTGGHGPSEREPSRREPSQHDSFRGQTGGHGSSAQDTSVRESSRRDLSRGQTGGHGPSSQEPSLREPSQWEPYRRQSGGHGPSTRVLSTQDSSRPRRRSTFTPNVATTIEATAIHPTSRIRTSQAPLGDMARTYIEGMVPPSEYLSEVPSGDSSNTKVKGLIPVSAYERERYGMKTYPAHTQVGAFQSRAPSHVGSIFQTPEDERYASRQTRIANMTPEERRRQETWAQSMIQRAGVCPQGYAWRRVQEGYHCEGESHLVTDELIAEGKGGVLILPSKIGRMQPQWGPYYKDPNDAAGLIFGGDPNDNHPEWINHRTGEIYWDKAWKIAGLSRSPKTPEEIAAFEDALKREVFGYRGATLPSSMLSGGKSPITGVHVIFKGRPVPTGRLANIVVNGRRVLGP